jgi:SAM-dependent methyltransferase
MCCGGSRWIDLPDPGPQSVTSDWRVVEERLRRRACARCGLAAREASVATGDSLYGDGYALYAHAPGGAIERARQGQYASWIVSAAGAEPARVLDVGCGNGSLLVALRDAWPGATLSGCDASGESVAAGTRPDLRLWQGTAATLAEGIADLVVAVNVIEHTDDPVAFLRDLRRAVTPAGTVIVVCPDGDRPGVELLFADHLFSFTSEDLRVLASRSGLAVHLAEKAPAPLGAFQMIAAHRGGSAADVACSEPLALNRRRASYLQRWADLDAQLAARLPAAVVCFGAGEAAGLLRGYAPSSWSRVRACTADTIGADRFGAVPMVPLDRLPADTAILVGVRPEDQRPVADRLAARFASVTTWYDLVPDSAE